MITIICGVCSYILYFIYDLNTIKGNNKFLKSFFLLGTILGIFSTVFEVVTRFNNENLYRIIISSIIGVIFLGLEIYTLFFSIPFKSTYVEDSKERLCYRGGMYSFSRHPGVLWYIGLYGSLMFLTYNLHSIIFFSMMILLDIAYIIYQDLLIFPRTFTDYNDYKKETSFLIPFKKRGN